MRAVPLIIITLFFISLIPVSAYSSSSPLVCFYYYPWYGAPDHPWVNVTDTPVLGFYFSGYLSVISRHLTWIRDSGANCLFISWWGPGHFTDQVARLIFQRLGNYGLKGVILVEPYLGGNPVYYDESWWNKTLEYINQNYIQKYRENYLYLDGKPLIIAFNPIGMHFDPRPVFQNYTIRIIGNDIDNAKYQDWDLWPDYDSTLSGNLRIRKDGYVAISPRFDDEHFRPGGVPPYDPNLTKGWYKKQWQWILKHRNQVKIIAIYSWNEFHERSEIEPHYDSSARVGPYYLYNMTQYYIQKLHQPEETSKTMGFGAALGLIIAVFTVIAKYLARFLS